MLSQITQVMIAAPLVAPTLGGFLLVWLGWPAIFVTLGAAGALLWTVCWRGVRKTLPRRQPSPRPSPRRCDTICLPCVCKVS